MLDRNHFQLKNIVPKAFWGLRHNPSLKSDKILPISDHEVLLVVGSRLAILDYIDNNRSKLTYLGPRKVTEIIFVSISSDLKYVATSIDAPNSKATMLIHLLENHSISQFRTPRLLQHTSSDSYDCITFSADSSLIAAITNVQSEGVLIYDRVKEILLRSVNIGSLVTSVSFNPDDNTRVCTTGTLLQFWRYTVKAVHNAPIAGLHSSSVIYTCHTWLPDRRVVVGSDRGELIVISHSSVQSTHLAFGVADQHDYESEGKVAAILANNNHVVAANSSNSVAVFEIVYLSASTTTVSSSNSQVALILKSKFRLGSGVTNISGLQLSIKSNAQSDSQLLVVTQTALLSFELFDCPSIGLLPEHSFLRGMRPISPLPLSRPNTSSLEPEWVDLQGKVLYSFHGGQIDRICLAPRSSSFVTCSAADCSIRLWNYTKPFCSPEVTEDYQDHRKDMPLEIALHPSGWILACATRDSVVSECAVTLSGLTAVRQVVAAKIPFMSSDGTSYATTSPVSLLKYSHGGHLLAVVCGKLVQVFHMYHFDYNFNEISSGRHGKPRRLMTIVAHGSAVSDITFSADDSTIYSCAVDGTVYSHVVSIVPSDIAVPYSGEYFTRGGTALKVVISESKMLIVCYEGSSSLTDARGGRGGYLAMWTGGELSDSPMLIFLDTPVRDIALTTARHGTNKGVGAIDLCVMGFLDGSVLVSFLPFPVLSRPSSEGVFCPGDTNAVTASLSEASCTSDGIQIQGPDVGLGVTLSQTLSQSTSMNSTGSRRQSRVGSVVALKALDDSAMHIEPPVTLFLDVSKCKSYYLHSGAVSSVAISADGNRIFTTGNDGAVFMLALSRLSKTILNGEDEEEERAAAQSDWQNDVPGESFLMLADKKSFESLRSHTVEVKLMMEDRLRDSDKAFVKLSEQTEARILDLETKLKREVSKRDAIILNERENHRKEKMQLSNELSSFEKKQAEAIAKVELGYEYKLAQEALYLDRMRQAYEESALHIRLDKKKSKAAAMELHMKQQAEAAFTGKLDAAKQKEALLTYVEYVTARNDEIQTSLEKAHEKEMTRLKKESAELTEKLNRAKKEEITKETASNRLSSQLTMEVAAKDDHLLRLKNDLDWAEGRVERLEGALQQATLELKKRTDLYEKWEYKAGDQQQQISEMERIRKALTVQIHGLRQEMGPKEEQILLITEKLQEMDREYDLALKAVSDKEVLLTQRSASLHMLNKQVRDLRSSSATKEASLKRAALLYEQYRQALAKNDTISTSSKAPAKTQGSSNNGNGGKKTVAIGKSPAMLLSKSGPVTSAGGRNGIHPVSHSLSLVVGDNNPEDAAATLALSSKEDCFLALQRLGDVLRSHHAAALIAPLSLPPSQSLPPDHHESTMADDALEASMAYTEKEKQVKQLHKNVNALKGNLEKTHMLADMKARNQLNDNEQLLKDVSDMRHEIRQLSIDNHRLRTELVDTSRRYQRESRVRVAISVGHSAPTMAITETKCVTQHNQEDEAEAEGDLEDANGDEHGDEHGDERGYDEEMEKRDVTEHEGYSTSTPGTISRGDTSQGRGEGRHSTPMLDDSAFGIQSAQGLRVSATPDSLEQRFSELLSADQKISALMAMNDCDIRNERAAGRIGDVDSAVVTVSAQDILNFHKRHLGRRSGALVSVDSTGVNLSAGGRELVSKGMGKMKDKGREKGRSSGSSQPTVKISNASLQLPDVCKPLRAPR